MKLPRLAAPLAATFLAAAAFAQNGKPDAEGFIRDWLVLAPTSIESGNGAGEIDRKQFATEAQPAAKECATESVNGKPLIWRKIAASEFYVDFRALNPNDAEQVAGWAVAYLVLAADKSGLTLHMNSNDQGKVYLNGKELVKFTETRTLEKDAEDKATGVTLRKGVNVLVLKVINEENNWQGSVRFFDGAKPFTGYKVATSP